MASSRKSRAEAVGEGRCMVRVRHIGSGEPATAAMCPGCWNDPARRPALLGKLARMGVEPVHRDDQAGGRYRAGQKHAPHCPFLPEPHWRRFARALRRSKS